MGDDCCWTVSRVALWNREVKNRGSGRSSRVQVEGDEGLPPAVHSTTPLNGSP